MVKDLVSIITPCYNGEKTISRLMESILNQTYKQIEFILVNDGSTDKTEEVAKSYEQKFTDCGMIFKYIYQENQGLGGAINTGLKHFTGEYLCWPDADDYLEINSVLERVFFLKNNPQYAVVTSNAFLRNEDNLSQASLLVKKVTKQVKNENQFDLMLNGDSVFCSGCHMIRTEAFLEVNPEREIYPARRGQNWQMLLPMYYKFKRFFLNKPLYNYVLYKNSMSRRENSKEIMLSKYEEHKTIIIETLKQIERNQGVRLIKYFNFATDKYFKVRLWVALLYADTEFFMQQYIRKQEEIGLDNFDRMLYYRNRYRLFDVVLKRLRREDRIVGKFTIKKLAKSKNKDNSITSSSLVSVIIPCYNGEKFLESCFDSILRQTYREIELVVVNDGSTDNSENIILSYKPKVEKKGYTFKYLSQSNQGAAAAVNNALKIIEGEYLMLYDVDDILFNDCVKEKTEFLHSHPQYAMVRNNGYYVKSKDEVGKELFVTSVKEMKDENLFESLLEGTTNNWPGSYMVRTSVLFEALSGREIYTSHYGQNLQIMMPVAFISKCAFINKPLMKYFIHTQSHSHSGGRKRAIERSKGYEGNRYGVLDQLILSETDLKKYKTMVKNRFNVLRLHAALLQKDEELFNEEFSKLEKKRSLYKMAWLLSWTNFFVATKFINRIISCLKRVAKNFYYNFLYYWDNTKNY